MIAVKRTASFFACIVFMLAIPATTFPCGDTSNRASDTPRIEWVGTFEGALTLARKRVAPVFVTVSHGDEDPEVTGSKREYDGASVVGASRSFVCLFASFERHAKRAEAGKKSTCSRFQNISCEQHIEVAAALKKRSLLGADPGDTGYLILNPLGEVIDRQRPGITSVQLLRFMDRGLAHHRKTATATIIKSLKNRKATVKAAAFQDAVSLLTEDKALKRLQVASAKYLKRLESSGDTHLARKTIAKADSEGALSLLVPFLRDRKPRTRIDVLRVFATAEPRVAFLDDLVAHARVEKREDALQQLVKVLETYAAKFPKAVKSLNKLVMHRIASVKVLATLAAARPGNKAIYKELVKRCRREAHVAVRTSAILGLALMEAKEALPALKKLQKKKGGQSDLAQVLDVAIRKLAGSDDVGFDLEQQVKQLKNAVTLTTS